MEQAQRAQRVTVEQAAKAMNVSKLFIRLGLQRKELDFGYAVKTGKKQYSYFIDRKVFEEKTGRKVE
ncbi:MAG: hypothetical protein RR827_03625 [Oscillospiraceae bacterium]